MSAQLLRRGLTSALERRGVLRAIGAGPLAALLSWLPNARAGGGAPGLVPLAAPEPIASIAAGEGGLLAMARSGTLLRLSGRYWETIGEGFDPNAPVAAGHGRIVGRSIAGWLQVIEDYAVVATLGPRISDHGGFVNLAQGIVAVSAEHSPGEPRGRRARFRREQAPPAPRLVRFEREAAVWREAARSNFAVLPDARPVLVDLGGAAGGSEAGAHVAVLAGPDAGRYRHGVLGDPLEATAIVYAERHSLVPLATITLPEPQVFEDLALRPVVDPDSGQTSLATVRSGDKGAALVLVGRSRTDPAALALIAEGPALGMRQRWLAPIVAGQGLYAIHTPHIGGVLTFYRRVAARLLAQPLRTGVSNHTIGSRDLNVAALVGSLLLVPSQQHDELVALDLADGARERWRLRLKAPVSALLALGDSLVVLDASGRVFRIEKT
jgi:hypothetical protein